MELEVRIERLGAQGDGVAQGPQGPLFVPLALPGELVRVDAQPGADRAELITVIEPALQRVPPVCRHFGACGGCALQHIDASAYLAWKREQVLAAFRSRGIEAAVEDVRTVSLRSRRRASFALGRNAAGLSFGYRAARSHDIVSIEDCPVLTPRLEASLPRFEAILGPLVGHREARVTVTDTETGLDIAVEGLRSSAYLIGKLAAEAEALGVARLTLDGETAALLAEPAVTLSDARVKLPQGAFLQASREAEAVLAALVVEGVGKAKRVADLFAGIGTLTFALARASEVDAFEENEAAIGALAQAVRETPKLKPVRSFARDLFRAPLGRKELARYDAVVLDPPRAGAKAQSEALAGSKVKKIVMVSCNPATCARDARALIDGGYRLTRVVPVDQFLFSPHIELVACLER